MFQESFVNAFTFESISYNNKPFKSNYASIEINLKLFYINLLKLDYVSYFSNRYKLELFQLVDESMQKMFIQLLADNVKNLMIDLKSHMKNFKPYFYESERVALKILELLITIAKLQLAP